MWAARLLVLLVVLLLGAAGFVIYTWRPAIDPIEPPAKASFDAALVAKGAELAAIGDCNRCHTKAGGRPFAGGRPLPTPFGTIYATNVTPDPETGIGRWSETAFRRAMREGVDRAGRHLYPAFPYDHFTKATDEDLRAIYAFLMTRDPVRAEAPTNKLPFPLNLRFVLAGWKLLFLRQGVFRPDPARDAQWNRGAYLVEGLGHCGACHTPRNRLGGEERAKALAGGEAEHWHAPALNAASPAPVPWTADSLFAYLRHGSDALHGVAAGPMGEVVENLARVPEEDVRAMAAYVASVMGPPTPERQSRANQFVEVERAGRNGPGGTGDAMRGHASSGAGATIYAGACAGCHDGGELSPLAARPLALYTDVMVPDPRNLIHVILKGIAPPEGEAGPMMPGFADALTDAQVAALAAYVRARFSDGPAWGNIEDQVHRIRQASEAP